jgi:hypothetical protein
VCKKEREREREREKEREREREIGGGGETCVQKAFKMAYRENMLHKEYTIWRNL